MGYRVLKYQETPNPNALKVYLDRRAGGSIRSYFRPEEAAADSMAAAIFAVPGVTNVLINGDWLTVNKSPGAPWPQVKQGVEAALAGAAE